MADQCIICFDALDIFTPAESKLLLPDVGSEAVRGAPTALGNTSTAAPNNHQSIAQIKTCGHILHDECLQAWTEKANSCPMCRQAFHLVEVYDKIGGTLHNCHNSLCNLSLLMLFSGTLLST